ncbi:MAG: RNA-binding protein [Planctomycetota bacterium]
MDVDVYVGNLDPLVTEDALRAAFTKAGHAVTRVSILRSSQGDRSRGFGFVRATSEELASAMITGMNGVELSGKKLKVAAMKESSRPSGRASGRRLDEDGGYGTTGPRRNTRNKSKRRS